MGTQNVNQAVNQPKNQNIQNLKVHYTEDPKHENNHKFRKTNVPQQYQDTGTHGGQNIGNANTNGN